MCGFSLLLYHRIKFLKKKNKKKSACIRYIKRTAKRSHLQPELYGTVLQLWNEYCHQTLSNKALRERFFSSEHAACSKLKRWKAVPDAYAAALRGVLNRFWFALQSSSPKYYAMHGNSVHWQPCPLFAVCLWHALFVCPSEAHLSFSTFDVHCHGLHVLKCLQCPLAFLWNTFLVLLLVSTF